MAVKLIDLQLIYGVAGAREKFEDLASQLVQGEQPDADKVRIVQGDGGIDVFVGDLTDPGGIDVYQCKFFPQGLDDSQKDQVRKSYRTCRDSTKFKTRRWTLCLPVDMSLDEKKWFEEWRSKQSGSSVVIESPWGALKLEGLLHADKNRGLKEAFFKEQHLTQIRELHTMLTQLVPDILARLAQGSAADARESEARARAAEYLDGFVRSLRDHFAFLSSPEPVKMSDIQKARQAGDRQRADALEAAGKPLGRWEVVISPSQVSDGPRLQTLKDCREAVEACQVRSHGWEFPAVPLTGQETGSDWLGMSQRYGKEVECWRLTQRGVFAHIVTLFDDLQSPPPFDERWAKRRPAGFVLEGFLDVEVAVRVITHAFRFAARLADRVFDPAEEAVDVSLHLTSSRNRVLTSGRDTSRMHDWYIATAPSLAHTWRCGRDELRGDPDGLAVGAAVWFFERFNWVNATAELVARTQTRVFTGA